MNILITKWWVNKIRKLHECVFGVKISHEWFSWPGNPRDRRSRKPRVWYFHSKNTRVPFFVYHMPLLRVFWGIFSSNRRKFNSEIQDPNSTWCRDYVKPTGAMPRLRHNDVTPTGAMMSLGHVGRHSNNTHDVTEVLRRQSQCTCVFDTTVQSGKILHDWIARLTMAKIQ
jgi:hypothetical protein